MTAELPFIVVADRDRTHERLVTAGLGQLGYEAFPARDPATLQKTVDEVRCVDALLVDLSMFGNSVMYLSRVIHAHRPRLVILMLGLGTGLSPDVARTSGFDACFSKIVDVKRLDRFLRDHLPLSRRPRQLRQAL